MVDAGTLLARVREETEAMIAVTAQLAAIDSGSQDAAGIAAVCSPLGERLAREHGFTVTTRPQGGLEATITTSRPGRRLLIVGHADTVWPAGTARDWPVSRDATMLGGPGVGDMKACLVMAAHAVSAARAADGLRGISEVTLLVVPDEELGSVASRGWIEARAAGAGACLGLEAGWPGGGVVVQRGAVGAVTLTAQGRTAHVAGHEGTGASAIAALAPLVAAAQALSDPPRQRLVSVGVFRGGVARQVVPDHAEMLVDLRAPSTAEAQALLAGIDALLPGPGAAVPIVRGGGITRPAMERTSSQDLFARAAARAAQLEIPLRPEHSRGGSDASFAAALGIPTLDGLGPICHDSCARGERIEIASLAERAALMALLICDLGAEWAAD